MYTISEIIYNIRDIATKSFKYQAIILQKIGW